MANEGYHEPIDELSAETRDMTGMAKPCRIGDNPRRGGADMPDDATVTTIETEADLRAILGPPLEMAVIKSLSRLDKHCRAFIERSPFLCIGTMSANGQADVSPKGDPRGFVRILDDAKLLIPDRPGNNRVDTMRNLLANPSIGLLFFIPGFEDTLRINGRATIVRSPALLADCAVNGKVPQLAIRVEIGEAFLHCAKALKRSRLWDPATFQDRRDLPSHGRMVLEQTAAAPPSEQQVEEVDALVDENYRNELY